jgi:hypothetical protein
MVNAVGEKIYWNTNYLIGEDALFGIVRGQGRRAEKAQK